MSRARLHINGITDDILTLYTTLRWDHSWRGFFDALAYLGRGTAYHKRSEYQSAIADFTKAIKLRSNDASVYTSRCSADTGNVRLGSKADI